MFPRFHPAYHPLITPAYHIAPIPRTEYGIGRLVAPGVQLVMPTDDGRTGQEMELDCIIATVPPVSLSSASTHGKDETAKAATIMMEQYITNPDRLASSRAGSRQSDKGRKTATGCLKKTKNSCVLGQASRARGDKIGKWKAEEEDSKLVVFET